MNPATQGKYLRGSDHPILAPEQSVARGIMTAVVLNPNYAGEAAPLLSRLGSAARTCDLTQEGLTCG